MAFSFAKTRPSPIALDFGADSLKALQIIPGQPPQLIAAGAISIPGDARQDPAKRKAFLGSAVQRLMKSQPFKGRRAICSVPAFRTLVQHLAVPKTDGADIKHLVGMHLMERLGVDPNRMVIRTYDLGQRKRDGQQLQEVACLAVPRDTVMSYIRLAEQARLEVVGMHSEPPVILKAFENLFNRRAEDHTSVTCYVDIGAASTKVVVADGFKLVFAKRIDAGGDQVTEALAEGKKLSFDDARRRRMAMAQTGAKQDGGAPQDQSQQTNPRTEQASGCRAEAHAPQAGASSDSPPADTEGQAHAATASDESPTGQERRKNPLAKARTGVAALDAMMLEEPTGHIPEPGIAHAVANEGSATKALPPVHERTADATVQPTEPGTDSANAVEGSVVAGLAPVTEPSTPTLAPALAEDPKLESEMLDCLIDELRMCLRHYQAHRPDRPVDRLVFLGGESKHVEACRHVARSVKLPAQLGNPFARLEIPTELPADCGIDPRVPQPGWAVPFGLCFSEANL